MTEPRMPNRAITPLWIIALFVSLTEAVLGVAVTQTTEGIQIALTTFVIVFPLLIALAFFLVLWNKPYVFYPPTEFGRQVDVRQYVEAMQQRASVDENKLYEDLQRTIRTTLSSKEMIDTLTQTFSRRTEERVDEKEVARILASAADKTLETIREENFLTIDTRPLLGEDGITWQVPYDRFSNINDFLNHIYFKLAPHVPAYTYGETWLLRDAKSGEVLSDLGREWAEEHGFPYDSRNLKSVGIVQGMVLEVSLSSQPNKAKGG